MFGLLRHLLVVCWYFMLSEGLTSLPQYNNGFFYQDINNGNGNGEIYFNGIRLLVESQQSTILAIGGSNVTLPCHYRYEPQPTTLRKTRVKWSWLPTNSISTDASTVSTYGETEVMVAMGNRYRSFGSFRGRVRLSRTAPGDMSLVINELGLKDMGRYRCEVIDGLEDESATVDLTLEGVVFPYYTKTGRYNFNFVEAQKACQDQDATLATFEQLFKAWEEGLAWCNAGWLADGTVQYPITKPRNSCGGVGIAPGLRSYGPRHRVLHRFDAFCFSSANKGKVYFLNDTKKFNFTEAVHACASNGSQIAKVGQLHSAWKLIGYEQCNSGWLADGSVRYPMTKTRSKCGPREPGVRNFGFPPLSQKSGVYCYR